MNALAEKYGDKLNILGFFCNQFGHQTNEDNGEILSLLKNVRPGGGFEPAPAVTLFEKVDVNGANSHPFFSFLRKSIKIPCGAEQDSKSNGCADSDVLILPRGGFGGTTVTLWSPVTRSDIAWNFEKFLLDKDGKPVQRYNRYFLVDDIAPDIDALL